MGRMRRFFMLCLCVLLGAGLVACGGGTVDATSETVGTTATDGVTETTESAAADLPWTVGGESLSGYVIIHERTRYAEDCAKQLRLSILAATGHSLTVLPDSVRQSEREILVGKTNRAESDEVRADFPRPNLCYRAAVVGQRLVLMGEGYTSLRRAVELFDEYLISGSHAMAGELFAGDIIDAVDTLGVRVIERAEGTALRVLHWNMAAPYLDPAVTAPPVVYDNNTARGEVMADILLQMLPDMITTNEFYESHNGDSTLWRAVMGQLEEYYIPLDSPYDKDWPRAGADAIRGKTINSNILIRRDAGIEVLTSAWRYSTEQTTVTAANPGGYVYYHGSHTALMRQGGETFILSVAHYADSRSDSVWAREQLDAIADAAAAAGGEAVPVILTGDLYTGYTSSSPDSAYRYLTGQGYVDAQRSAAVNANGILDHGTFHKIGERQVNRISEDLIFCRGGIGALCFKVLTSADIDDVSDHYPVMADLCFD